MTSYEKIQAVMPEHDCRKQNLGDEISI